MANHDDQFQVELTPVAAASDPSTNVTTIHNPADPDQSLDTEWDTDKTEVLTDTLDSRALSAWLTDSMGFDIEMTRFPFVIGRSDDCDLTPNGRGLSRRHVEIIFHSGRFVIRDLDSLNGIQVNGCKVARVILDDGDEISVGDTQFTFKHRNPADQPQLVQQTPTASGNNKWLKLSAFASAALVVLVAGLSVFQQYFQSESPIVATQTSANKTNSTPTQTPNTPPPKITAEAPSKEAVATNTGINVASKPVDLNLIAQQPPHSEAVKPDIINAPQKVTNATKKQRPKPNIKRATIAKANKAIPAPAEKKQRQESTRNAKNLLKNANSQYLAGNASQIIRQLKIAGLSKNLPASTKREVTKKYNLLNQLHGFYTAGNKAVEKNNNDKAFESWDIYLDRLELNFPGETPPYASEVTHYMAEEYALRAKQASGTKQYQLAYQFWQKALSLTGNPTAESQIALIEEKAHQLYRQGLRQEYVNSAKAKKLWRQVVKLVPPSSDTFTKANAKLVWYARWEN